MNARAALQEYIDAQESWNAIEYGLRSVRLCKGASYCTGPHAGQLARARTAAEELLGEPIVASLPYGDYKVEQALRDAKKAAREKITEARAARKLFGGLVQQRLAIAGDIATLGPVADPELAAAA